MGSTGALIVAFSAAIVGPLGAILASRRRNTGGVSRSDATDLWKAQEAFRTALQGRIQELHEESERRGEEVRAAQAECEETKLALRDLTARFDALSLNYTELQGFYRATLLQLDELIRPERRTT